MNIYIFAIFVIQLLFILISSLLPLLFHLSRIPTYYHFRLSPLFSDIQQHGILLFSLLSAFVPNYIFCLHLTNHLLLLFVFPFLLMSYFLLPFLHFFLFYISFSSYWFSYSSSCTVFSSFLISSLYASPPLTYSPLYAFEFLFTTPFFPSSYYCSRSVFITSQYPIFFFFTPVPYFPLLPCCKLKDFSYSSLDIRICCSICLPRTFQVWRNNIRNTGCIPWCQNPDLKHHPCEF